MEYYGNTKQGPARSIVDKFGNMQIPAIDNELAQSILNIKPEELEYRMLDILSKKERKALVDRLKGVQRAIRSQMQKEDNDRAKNKTFLSKFPKNEKEWKHSLEEHERIVKNEGRARMALWDTINSNMTSEKERRMAQNAFEKTLDINGVSYLMSEIMGGQSLQ